MKYFVLEFSREKENKPSLYLNDFYTSDGAPKWRDLNEARIFKDADDAFILRTKLYVSGLVMLKDSEELLVRELTIGNIVLQKFFIVMDGKSYYTTENGWDDDVKSAKRFPGTMTVAEILRALGGNYGTDVHIVECKA